jgi:branched-chain amino acid transport system substrate-binding protein
VTKRLWAIVLIVVIAVAAVAGIAYYMLTRPASLAEFRVGVIAPATGSEAWIGIDSWRGARDAAAEVNAAGGINGLNITIFEYDDADNPTEAVSQSRRAIFSDGCIAGILGTGSDTSLAAMSVWNDAKIPCVISWAGHPDLTKGAGWMFRVGPIADVIGRGLAVYAYDTLGLRKTGSICTDDAYEISVKDSFLDEFTTLGGTNVYDKVVEWGEKSYEPLLTQMKSLGIDGILSPCDYTMSTPLTTQARGLGLNQSIIYLGPSSGVQEFIDGVGETALVGPLSINSYSDATTEAFKAFEEGYGAKYGGASSLGYWLTYDSLKILADAMKAEGTTPDQIKKGLSETTNYVGLAGKVTSFTAGGECLRAVIILGIELDTTVPSEPKLVFYKEGEIPADPSWVPR